MKQKIKVMHIISDTNIGGAGKLLLTLSECIDNRKFEFTYALPNNSLLYPKLKKQGRTFVFKGPGDKSFSVRAVFSYVI
jgi:hypothetical protein